MPSHQISLDDIINLRDCSHYLRRAISTCLLSEQVETKRFLNEFVDKLDGVVARILADAREEKE